MTADLIEVVLPLPADSAARARNMPASDRPAPKAPIWRKLRRLTPSQ